MRKNNYQKLAFMIMLLTILLIYQKHTSKEKEPFPEIKFIIDSSVPAVIRDFNPNSLNHKQWQELGFSEKQASTILKYKDIVGGKFISKEQLKKCYAISEEKFKEIESFILLPENHKKSLFKPFKSFEKNKLIITGKFNPDLYSTADWIKMGFSEKQADAILKYKSYLGGSFISKEKFKECFMISSDHYTQLAPYVILPSKTPDNFKKIIKNHYSEKSNMRYQPFDPNNLGLQEWQSLGFSEKQAQIIVNYRDRNLHGRFESLEDLQKCFVISVEKFKELRPYITLTTSLAKKENIQQQKTDFSQIDLNEITFKQLLEFGLDEKSAGSIIGFRKKLGGFVTKQQISDTYNIDKERVQKLLDIAPLKPSAITRYSLNDAPEEWLKNHPYFKYSADKIIFYRITNPDDKKIWKFLKLKPEYEERMKLYLK